MTRTLLSALLALSLSGCFLFGRKQEPITSEPSIERALDIISAAPEGKALVRFLYKSGVRVEYSVTPGVCHKFAFRRAMIYIPREYRASDLLLAMDVARAGYIWRVFVETGLEELLSEHQELGVLFQSRLGLQLNLVDGDFEKNKFAEELKSEFCSYFLDGSKYAMQAARRNALGEDRDCQRPLETLQSQRAWLQKTAAAIADDQTLFGLLYARDMLKVRRGVMTQAEAMANDALFRALPMYELYRFQRMYYEKETEKLSRFEKFYRDELSRDAAWREKHAAEIERAKAEFSSCNLPV